MADFRGDLRFGVRQLRKNPGFTLAAVACMGLGIGANTATFTFANSLLFRKNPHVREPGQLVRLFIRWSSGLRLGSFSYPDYVDLRDRNRVFTGLVAENLAPVNLSAGDRNERIYGSLVSGNYFSELGIAVRLGRALTTEDDRTEGGHPVVVVSHGLWQRRFGADPGVVGRTLILNGNRFTVIGVGPEGFSGTNVGIQSELWVPFMMLEQISPGRRFDQRGNHWIGTIIGRLRTGVTAGQARESLNTLMAALVQDYPDSNTGKSIDVFAEAEASLHPAVRHGFVGFLVVMFGVVGLILALACANVAGLLLARSVARRREMGIRMALGANRRQLMRQLLAESLLLSLVSGGAGLLLGVWLTRLIASFRPPSDLPIQVDVGLDWRVLAFTFLAAVASGVVFGLAPALQTTRQDIVTTLKDGSSQSGGRWRLRGLLVVGQVALSAILLIGAGLAVRSLETVRQLNPGFNPENLFVGGIDLDLQGYDRVAGEQFHRALKEKTRTLPGVIAVGLARAVPLQLSNSQNGAIPEGYVTPEGANPPSIDYNVVGEGYFEAMGIPILRGRGFLESDTGDSPPVLVVNQRFVERFWPGQVPLGKQVRTSGANHTVIGVVPDGKYFSLGEDPKAFMYYPLAQRYDGTTFLHVRTAGEPTALFGPVRRVIGDLDPGLPIFDLKPMHQALGLALLPARLAAGVISSFAGLALLLAAVGLYGVISYWVSQSKRDIALRVALGARPADVLKLVVRQGMGLAGVGLVLGVAGGFVLTRVMAGLLYGVSATDPISFASASAVVIAVAGLASFVPARRATRVDPMTALRLA